MSRAWAIRCLVTLYWQWRRGLVTEDEFIAFSGDVLKESLEDHVRVALAEIWGW